jgi:uncharacterized protein (DUF1810 family)
LGRFVDAQEGVYSLALSELRSGRKETHWIWFVFPQIEGLGHSWNSRHYAIKSLKEAREYLKHPVLGRRLVECSEAVLALRGRSILEILGHPDDLKFRSSMTLFEAAAGAGSLFSRLLDKYFDGTRDARTLRALDSQTG